MTKHRLNLRKVAIIACLAAFFANNALAQTYNVGDITVINNIIANNGLDWTPATPADGSYIPADWTGCTWTSDATNKRITELDLSLSENLYGMLDVSGLNNLQFLDCSNSLLLTALDVSGLVNLKTLLCNYNQLTVLDVSGLVSLQTIRCSGNQLTTLNVSGLVNLQTIICSNNQLTAINVSGLVNLQWLDCSYNQLTALDLSGFVNLKVLFCQHNQLTGLNLTGISFTSFSANNQSVSLTMESNGTDYTAAVAFLDTPNSLEEGLSYSAGVLTSNNNTILTSPFWVQTGSTGRVLSGTLNFTYLELYTVTFAGVEISIPSQPILEGGKVSKPTDPERDNYDFGGWFTDSGTFLHQWNFATDVVTQDTTLYAKWTETTGISEIASVSVKIYPNPVKDELKIESGDLTIKKVEILDITGKIVGNSSNVSALSQGIYFVRIETDKGIITEKFVKE